jgi:hypothetical protein
VALGSCETELDYDTLSLGYHVRLLCLLDLLVARKRLYLIRKSIKVANNSTPFVSTTSEIYTIFSSLACTRCVTCTEICSEGPRSEL